jgi:restriction endonuclease
MSEKIELVYDRLVAEEKLKAGTKYERLAAVVFRQLTGQAAIHDLRLVGSSGVAHQIDAVVGEQRSRVLIEAKDYDTKIGLSVVRDFWGVVEDVRPSEAYIVTTEGFTKPAIQFAQAKGIKLALLRPPRDEDWANLVRRIGLQITATGQTGPPAITWQLHPDDRDKIAGDEARQGLTHTEGIQLADEHGELRPFLPLLEAQLHEDYGNVPLGGEATIGRVNRIEKPTWLHAPGLPALRVEAWKWEVHVASSTTEMVIGDAAGDLAAELMLKSVDGSIHRMFTNRDIESWTFDGKTVVPKPEP